MLGNAIYPSVYVSDLEFGEFHKQKQQTRDMIAFASLIADIRIWLRTDGYVILDTGNKKLATELCNSFFLSLSLLGRSRVLPVVEKEFEEVTLMEDFQRIRSRKGKIVGLRNLFSIHVEVRDDIERDLRNSELVIYNSSQVRIALELAEDIFQSKNRNGILTFYECFSAFDRGDWTTSLLLGWITIEMMLYAELRLHLSQKGVYDALTEYVDRKWHVYTILDFLSRESDAGQFGREENPMRFNSDELKECDELRRIRNRVIHEGYRAGKEEATRCKTLAERALRQFMRIEGIDYNNHYDRMQEIYRAQGLTI
ncbi:MAG: hypothetical protein KAW09_05865 [Thermoplasmata archaeon]|nr:hypothetical protein [Thermoplasmata archaeon]